MFGVALNALGFVGSSLVAPGGKSGSGFERYFLGDVDAQDPVRFGFGAGIDVMDLGRNAVDKLTRAETGPAVDLGTADEQGSWEEFGQLVGTP